jgi:hypothetical protein
MRTNKILFTTTTTTIFATLQPLSYAKAKAFCASLFEVKYKPTSKSSGDELKESFYAN